MWEQTGTNTFEKKNAIQTVNILDLQTDISVLNDMCTTTGNKISSLKTKIENEQDQDIIDGLTLILGEKEKELAHWELTKQEKEQILNEINGN